MASLTGATGTEGWAEGGAGGDEEGEQGHLDPSREDDSPKGGATTVMLVAGEARAANKFVKDMMVV